jgi:hypothetical protein
LSVKPAETKWHSTVLDLIIFHISFATNAGGWLLAEVVFYQGIPFEITQGISVPRLL